SGRTRPARPRPGAARTHTAAGGAAAGHASRDHRAARGWDGAAARGRPDTAWGTRPPARGPPAARRRRAPPDPSSQQALLLLLLAGDAPLGPGHRFQALAVHLVLAHHAHAV